MLTRPQRPLPFGKRRFYPRQASGLLVPALGLILKGGDLPTVRVGITANTTNFNLFTAAGSPKGAVNVVVTIDPGVYVYSTSTAVGGFDMGVGWAQGSRCYWVNKGFVLGKGGKGAQQATAESGGPALILRPNLQYLLDNLLGAICGGGGGGGGTVSFPVGYPGLVYYSPGGGGAGGGDGGTFVDPYGGTAPGGPGGGPGASGSVASASSYSGGGGGGRIVPGVGGAGGSAPIGAATPAQGGGAGGGGGCVVHENGSTSVGGTGGSGNNAGGAPNNVPWAGGGGGGWGAAGNYPGGAYGAGVGGAAVQLNGQGPFWIATGTRFGAVA